MYNAVATRHKSGVKATIGVVADWLQLPEAIVACCRAKCGLTFCAKHSSGVERAALSECPY